MAGAEQNFKPAFEVRLTNVPLSGRKVCAANILPALPHGNDGLIFTPIDAPYKAGTDETLFKWKPPHLNSVDFELCVKRGYYLLNIHDNGSPVFEDWVAIPDHLRTESKQLSLPTIVECVRDPSIEVLVPNTESYHKDDETLRAGVGRSFAHERTN